ncbi:MAG: mOMP-like family protein [Parachlamydiales bacterium]|nr:mOMP-like family protein [Parachlamydiales bacterium]
MPVLTLLGVGAAAQDIAAQNVTKSAPTMQTPMPCGIVEGDNCLARGCACSYGGRLEFDFLYWQAQNTGFMYGYEIKDPNAVAASNNIGSIMRLPAKWDPGFRIGAGWNTDYDHWDVFAGWTWFRDHATKSRSVTGVTGTLLGFAPMWPNMAASSPVWQHVHAGWHMWHNACDLELGRAYYITKHLSLRPHYGLRGGWIHQKFTSSLTLPMTGSFSQLDFHGKNNFWGVGPRVGIQSNWHFCDNSWSVLGKASTALLLGETRTRYRSESLATGSTTFLTRHNVKDHFSQVVPNLQLFLGVDWSSCFNCDKYLLGINAGWEVNYYWNQFNILSMNEAAALAPTAAFGNHAVSMEGLTVNLHFDF